MILFFMKKTKKQERPPLWHGGAVKVGYLSLSRPLLCLSVYVVSLPVIVFVSLHVTVFVSLLVIVFVSLLVIVFVSVIVIVFVSLLVIV